ncbi:hypothetical protein Tco_0672819 [Tanacetum coccineum]
MVGFGGDDEGDDDGMMRVVALLLWLPDGEEKRRVKESGIMGIGLGAKTKSCQENVIPHHIALETRVLKTMFTVELFGVKDLVQQSYCFSDGGHM